MSGPENGAGPGPTQGTTGGRVAWALYDWANSAFATTVMAGFFTRL